MTPGSDIDKAREMKILPSWIWIFLFVGAVVLFDGSHASIAASIKKPSPDNIASFDTKRAGISNVIVVVAEIDDIGNGRARVTFAELQKRDEPQLKRGGRRIMWSYASPGQPVPVTKGMQAVVGVDATGNVADVFAEVHLLAYRKDPSGNLEVIAKASKLYGDASTRMHLRPNWIGLFTGEIPVDMIWSRDFGLMLTLLSAGGGESEKENMTARKAFPVGNEPGFSYTPGRDGWKIFLSNDSAQPEIPQKQMIWAAG